MKEAKVFDKKIIKITDLLEQIQAVDEMISLHEEKGDKGDLMLIQYQYKREKLLKELKGLLEELNIKPADLAA